MRRLRQILPALTILLPQVASGQATRPPNVVLIVVDDLGDRDLGCRGSTFYETPRLDALAKQGMQFTQAYAAAAVCSPTRAAILTGRSPARTGVTDWIRARFQRPGSKTPQQPPTAYVGGPGQRLSCPPNPFWLEHAEVTTAELLRPAGFRTCHIGKWHLGDDAWYPEHQGFDENHGGCDFGQPPSYFDPFANKRLPGGIPSLPPRRAGEYLAVREADEAVGFLRRCGAQPFFLHLAPYAVHTPLQGEKELVEHFARKAGTRKTGQRNATYAAMVHSVDTAVGRVLDALQANGQAANTLVVFTSDNGGLEGPTSNQPLRSGKGFPYEGGIRVPLIVRWPGVVAPGTVSHTPVTSVDLLPTILEATGVADSPAAKRMARDGTSLAAHLRSAAREALPERDLVWHFPHYRGKRGPWSIVRRGRSKLIRNYEGPTLELFDLEADPGEARDLAATRAELAKELDSSLTRHLAAVGAKLPKINPGYRPPARVLLLGDSISIGYTPFVRTMLQGVAEVHRPMRDARRPENCAGTTHGVARLDAWLQASGGHWDVIHFNFGLHDLKRVHPDTGAASNDPAHPNQAPLQTYERQLRKIVARLRQTGAKLVFATTTPVPRGVRPHREQADVERYNATARRVMAEHGIAVSDLHAFAATRLAQIQQKANVHFTREGSRVLAGEVARQLRKAIAARRSRTVR
ncbi:MAG: sulfatase-like hydrolase/transferase [Planctomycetes bacterium]|nr:sulfatase-like hydrolase/transferase [Planctomycetota bacterium]MCB9869917.1 sulfatase-like hydrolase/transferase [Planctomycetota bacterium]